MLEIFQSRVLKAEDMNRVLIILIVEISSLDIGDKHHDLVLADSDHAPGGHLGLVEDDTPLDQLEPRLGVKLDGEIVIVAWTDRLPHQLLLAEHDEVLGVEIRTEHLIFWPSFKCFQCGETIHIVNRLGRIEELGSGGRQEKITAHAHNFFIVPNFRGHLVCFLYEILSLPIVRQAVHFQTESFEFEMVIPGQKALLP